LPGQRVDIYQTFKLTAPVASVSPIPVKNQSLSN
jgi:hypothetical protein